jgi:hypothetical protein
MPIWMLLAIIPLVMGGPEVEFCQLSVYFTSAYLPVLGRCFSSSPSSFSKMPPLTVLVVVFCVPIPMSMLSGARCGMAPKATAPATSNPTGMNSRLTKRGVGMAMVSSTGANESRTGKDSFAGKVLLSKVRASRELAEIVTYGS